MHKLRDMMIVHEFQGDLFPFLSHTKTYFEAHVLPKSDGLHDDVGSVLQEFWFEAILMHLAGS